MRGLSIDARPIAQLPTGPNNLSAWWDSKWPFGYTTDRPVDGDTLTTWHDLTVNSNNLLANKGTAIWHPSGTLFNNVDMFVDNFLLSYSPKTFYAALTLTDVPVEAAGLLDWNPQALRLLRYSVRTTIEEFDGATHVAWAGSTTVNVGIPTIIAFRQRGVSGDYGVDQLDIAIDDTDPVSNTVSTIYRPTAAKMFVGSRDRSAFLPMRLRSMLVYDIRHDDATFAYMRRWLAGRAKT